MRKAIVFIVFSFVSVSFAAENCSRYCHPDRSKPCGSSCIAKDLTCRKSWTTACVGVNPNKGGKPGYENPKKVYSRPAGE